MSATSVNSNETPNIRIIKISTCKSLSNLSTLTYQIAGTCTDNLQLRVTENSGKGFFSKEWIAYADIQPILVNTLKLSSPALQSLYRSRSSNNSGFMFAVLRQEGLIKAASGPAGGYLPIEPAEFLQRAQTLIASNVDLSTEPLPKTVHSRKKQATPVAEQ